MKVAAFTGSSGAGKTHLMTAVISHYAALGVRVAAIKHTHHPLNEEHRGDTARFREAAAEPVLLAGEREAVVFSSSPARRIAYRDPADLLRNAGGADVVFIEGFKDSEGWPRIEVRHDARPSVAAILLSLDEAWASAAPRA